MGPFTIEVKNELKELDAYNAFMALKYRKVVAIP